MAREISAPNILDGVVTEIGRSGNVANIAVDVGNGNYFYSYINRDAFGRLDLKKDDHVKVIFPSTHRQSQNIRSAPPTSYRAR
ncbi:MAG: TOBE domain-containing protein [Candidatus Methanoperedens sp.]|nr:TOBE domain-containing protein [Candidatus Methanoperedens sp.]MCZ7405475.1 TOBE domain-containing protein [Candidatus Methanoperedens sp.]